LCEQMLRMEALTSEHNSVQFPSPECSNPAAGAGAHD
jgi:hypothetical protein